MHAHKITVSYVPNVDFVSRLSILNCPFGFITRLILLALNALIIERRRTYNKMIKRTRTTFSTKHYTKKLDRVKTSVTSGFPEG